MKFFKSTKEKKQSAPINLRLLIVDVVEAKDLIACDKKKGTSDPFVECCLIGLDDREKEKFRTDQQTKTINPKFSQSFEFGKGYNLDTKEADNVQVKFTIFHYPGGFSASSPVPLGEVKIGLGTIQPYPATTEIWYPLQLANRMQVVSGQLKLKLRFSRLTTDEDIEAANEPSSSAAVDEYNELTEDEEPNELCITAIQADGLLVMDKAMFGSGGSSDPMVRFKIEGQETKTSSFIRKTLTPVWNEEFKWGPLRDPSLSIQVTVQDHNDLKPVHDFMGRVILPLTPYQNKKSVIDWFKLVDKAGVSDKNRGRIQLSIKWQFSADVNTKELRDKEKYDKSFLGKIANATGGITRSVTSLVTGEVADEDMDKADGGDGGDADEDDALPPESEEQKKEKEEKEKEHKKMLEDIDIKSGDYQVQVHIIEARDLKAENEDGTSDPVTFVECFGQKQNTSTKYGQTSCVFDELLIFNMKNLDKEAFEEGFIRISVRDSNMIPGGKKTMIGAFAVDAMQVYQSNKEHEMYRKWVPLMDDEDTGDVGVQGYLKISVTILGPGDKMKMHDEDAEIAKEQAAESAAGGDLSGMCLSVPVIRREWKYIVVRVYRCEGLPVMDGKVGVGGMAVRKAGTDAFCKLEYGGAKGLKTKVVTVKGESAKQINPTFCYEMWYPVSIPATTQMIKFSVWDYDKTGSEFIGQIIEKFSNINKIQGTTSETRWYNFYGAPENKDGGLLTNATKAVKGVGDLVEDAGNLVGAIETVDYYKLYNAVPDRASAYKGRALLKFRVESKPPKNPKKSSDEVEIKPEIFKMEKPSRKEMEGPKTIRVVLRALVLSGTELPFFTDVSGGAVLKGVTSAATQYQPMRVRISMGNEDIVTQKAAYENGMCRWNELIESSEFEVPEDVTQIPDIFVYLVSNAGKAVSFYRLKPFVTNENGVAVLGFTNRVHRILLQEDKVLNALNDGEFPGSLLVKLGFGAVPDAAVTRMDWERCCDQAKTPALFQARFHIYQAKYLPATDSNGLCDPFIEVNFMGKKKTTKILQKTLFPEFYETIVFDDVSFSKENNFEYAPLAALRVYDKDTVPKVTVDGTFSTNEYMATTIYGLEDALITDDPSNYPVPDAIHEPKWIDFFREVPGDSSGSLLVKVQLIPIMTLTDVTRDQLRFIPDIKPEVKDCVIEIVVLGLRDLAPFNFQAMQAPFLEIEMNSRGVQYLQQTTTSKKPTPSNPNYLEKLILPCRLPVNPIFATPLQMRVRDTRLGGYLKPIVGVGVVDLKDKIPGTPNYKAPMTDKFFTPEEINPMDLVSESPSSLNADEVAKNVKDMQSRRLDELSKDSFVVQQAPLPIGDLVKKRMNTDDTGAGVFGALNHINLTGKKKNKADKFFMTDPDFTEDDGDQPPEWSIGREKLESELEVKLETTPFESYNLTRGQQNAGFSGSAFRIVGKFKGLICVKDKESDPSPFPEELLKKLFKPQSYIVRIYCLRATGLTPMDVDMFGNTSNSDPYLRITLGKNVFNDRENAVDDVTNCDLYKMVEFKTELPGTSQLKIEVMDEDIMFDELIGATTIDLEDRVFDERWQKLGAENLVLPAQVVDGKPAKKPRWETKPVEIRQLYAPTLRAPRGALQLWVDIMNPEAAGVFPPDDVSLPPTQTFEVRVVIWKTKDVPPMDSFEGMSDLFVKCWPEGCSIQETDTHWRCKKGKASFNWRLLFDVELGHSTRAMKFPYMHFQLWDRDIVKWNDCAGEAIIDLGRYFRKAYKKNMCLKLFEKKKGVQASRAKRNEKFKKDSKLVDDGKDVPPEEDGSTAPTAPSSDDVATSTNPMLAGAAGGGGPGPGPRSTSAVSESKDSDDDSDEEDGSNGAIPLNTAVELQKKGVSSSISAVGQKVVAKAATDQVNEKKAEVKKQAKETGKTWYSSIFGQKYEEEEDQPLLEDGEPAKTDEEKQDDEDAELKDTITQVKNMTGLWDIDPEDSEWLKISQKDHNTDKVTPMGQICYSIQIWPKDKANLFPVGSARSEPNTNPFCPPPVGRLKFSWNPFVLGSELCGPKLCTMFFCCLVCAAFIVLMIFCQPFLNIIINLVFLG